MQIIRPEMALFSRQELEDFFGGNQLEEKDIQILISGTPRKLSDHVTVNEESIIYKFYFQSFQKHFSNEKSQTRSYNHSKKISSTCFCLWEAQIPLLILILTLTLKAPKHCQESAFSIQSMIALRITSGVLPAPHKTGVNIRGQNQRKLL